MKLVCLDLEGVLLPEFWEEFSIATNIPALMKTTRDEPDYNKLMQMRLSVLEENNFGINEIKDVVKTMKPLEGAPEFINWLRERAQVVILTGTFYEYITPLMEKLGYPCMFANTLNIDKNGKIVGYNLREADGKVEMIKRFHDAGMQTIAIGDSFNDLSMLKAAGKGIIFRGCEALKKQEPQLDSAQTYEELKTILKNHL
jgi:phosphoserine / homoserine phosphotransferase